MCKFYYKFTHVFVLKYRIYMRARVCVFHNAMMTCECFLLMVVLVSSFLLYLCSVLYKTLWSPSMHSVRCNATLCNM